MLYIAEKPELARAIVDALGGGSKARGYYECGDDRVTWCYGHMLELYEPHDFEPSLKQWRLEDLPIFFFPWKKKPIIESSEQFGVIVGLLREADTVAHAGDPDAEGQLLVDEVLKFAGYQGKVLRVLINDNTPVVVKKALASMRDNAEFAGLSAAAEARQLADALYGYNMTRLYTLAARGEGHPGLISVGRVQTPILGLIVRRDRENAGHKKTVYYTVKASFRHGGACFAGVYQNRPDDPQDAYGRLIHHVHA
jgi:DNA topoisomerase-3